MLEMTNKLDYCTELFKNQRVSYLNNAINIDMEMEPYDVAERIDDIRTLIEPFLSKINLEIDSYRIYEEEYGGFCYYGVLQFDIDQLSFKELDLIKTLLFG